MEDRPLEPVDEPWKISRETADKVFAAVMCNQGWFGIGRSLLRGSRLKLALSDLRSALDPSGRRR
jgi:hypothetical protein